jgi:Lon protease-like protein
MKNNLPDEIPVFPLNGVIFFPKTNLPLNIFEKCYLEMIDYSFTSDKLIGMIQTMDNGDLYKVGCFGKINSYEETLDGRYLINLIGKSYFRIFNEKKDTKSFKTVEAEVLEPDEIKKNYTVNQKTKDFLIEKYFSFINASTQHADISLLKKIDSASLIKFLAMSSPFTIAEKQMLLETYDLDKMTNKIVTLFEYYSDTDKNSETIN